MIENTKGAQGGGNAGGGFLRALSDNSNLIKKVSKLTVYSFYAFIILVFLGVLFPSLLGSYEPMFTDKINEIVRGVFSEYTLIVLATYLFVFVVEAYCVGYKKSAIKSVLNPDNSTKKEIYIFILLIFGLWRYAIILSFFMIGYFFNSLFNSYTDTNLVHFIPNVVVQTILYFLIHDFSSYWHHRLSHRLSWWWALHKFHHSGEKLNVITVARAHPLDLALGGMFVSIPMGFLGAPVETFFIFMMLRMVHGKFLHTMLDWDFGVIGKYFLVSPIAHRVHHSPDPLHWDKNFGQCLIIWDRMFGTWYGGKEINTRTGVWGQSPNENSLFHDLIHGQMEFLALFFSKWKCDVGVLKPERVPVLSAQYREECKLQGKEP